MYIVHNVGHGDMAVSNAIGSNVFDILVCLGLPWFIDTALVNPGSTVRVKSKGMDFTFHYEICSKIMVKLIASLHAHAQK